MEKFPHEPNRSQMPSSNTPEDSMSPSSPPRFEDEPAEPEFPPTEKQLLDDDFLNTYGWE